MSKLREQLIQIQRKNYRENVQSVLDNLGYNPAIKKYEKEYLRYVKYYKEISNKTDLVKKILSINLVYHGDYHTLRQSQRSILRILREIHEKRDIMLCFEMFHGSAQKNIDSFLAGELSESAFLKKIEYGKKWPFSWRSWGPIIYFCRDNNIPILGINSDIDVGIKGLRERDKYSARIIAKALIRYPGKLIYVVDGDYHISPNHLPKQVDLLLKQLDFPVKHLIIYQNEENLYWKLCRQGREETDVIKVSENSYCVMNTLPANKIQSYLNWLEYSEDAYYPVHKDWEDDNFEDRGATVQEMVSSIASILGLKLPSNAFDNLVVFFSNNLYFMDFIQKIPEIKSHTRLIKEKIKRDEGFLLEYKIKEDVFYIIYLANSNINMAAEEASHLLHAIVRGRSKTHLNPFDRFYRNVIIECL